MLYEAIRPIKRPQGKPANTFPLTTKNSPKSLIFKTLIKTYFYHRIGIIGKSFQKKTQRRFINIHDLKKTKTFCTHGINLLVYFTAL